MAKKHDRKQPETDMDAGLYSVPELDALAAEAAAAAAAGTPKRCVNCSSLRPADSIRDQSSFENRERLDYLRNNM